MMTGDPSRSASRNGGNTRRKASFSAIPMRSSAGFPRKPAEKASLSTLRQFIRPRKRSRSVPISKGTPRQRRIRLVWHGRSETPFSAAVRLWMEIFFSGREADYVFRSWIRTGPHFRSSTSSRRSGPGQKTKTGISSRTPSPTPPCASGPMRENV